MLGWQRVSIPCHQRAASRDHKHTLYGGHVPLTLCTPAISVVQKWITALHEDVVLVAAVPSQSVADHWSMLDCGHLLTVHTLLFVCTLSSDWPLTYKQCQSKWMIVTADTAIVSGLCETWPAMPRGGGRGRGGSNVAPMHCTGNTRSGMGQIDLTAP